MPPKRPRRCLGFLALAVLECVLCPVWAEPGLPESGAIVTAAAVRRLSIVEAREGRPVDFEATVTHFHRRLGDGFFVQDETDGIYVRLAGRKVTLEVGDRVRIRGVTAAGDFAPVVMLRELVGLGRAPLPEARPVAAGALSSGRYDALRVRVRGVVTSVSPVERSNAPHLALILRVDDATVLAGVNDFSPASLALPDAEVVVTGVAGGLFSRQRQLLRGVLLVESESDIEIVRAAEDAAELAVHDVGELFRYRPDGMPGHRVRVRGIYQGGPRGGWLAVRDRTGGVFVEMSEPQPGLEPGDEVDLVGFPERRGLTLWLAHGRILSAQAGPSPVVAAGDFASALDRPGQLARLSGEVVGLPQPGANGWTIALRADGGKVLEANVFPGTDPYPTAWREGARLEVEGIAEAYTRGGQNLDLFPFPTDLRVHVRSKEDVKVVRAAPWRTSPAFATALIRLLSGAALLLVVFSLVAVFLARRNAVLRETRRELQEAREALAKRFDTRTGEWRQELAARHAAEADYALLTAERTRLAREIHDTLEQSLASVALQLDAVHALYPESPDEARNLLGQATGLLRESQAEVRRSVWNLRSIKLEEATLPEALEQLGKALHETGGPTISFRLDGAPVALPPLAASQFFRVAQEAVTNALKHARATRIAIVLAFIPGEVVLDVVDDGLGFDPAAGSREGHFGLRGLRERAESLGAGLSIKSAPGQGTRILLRAAIARLLACQT